MFALKVGLLLFFALVACRLVQIQVLEARRYQEIARKQSEVKVALPAARGNIYDRNGALLVSNAIMVSLGADPKMMGTDAGQFVARLARVFDHPRRYYMEKLDTDRRFVGLFPPAPVDDLQGQHHERQPREVMSRGTEP